MKGAVASPAPASRPPALVALALLLMLEAAGVVAAALTGFVGGPVSTTGVAVLVLALAIGALLVAVGVGLLRRRPWTRAATLTWQVVQLLVGRDAFQPPGARPDLGTLTVVPAVVAIVLLFTRRVREATARDPRPGG